jgi:hypothetical protein
MHLAMLSMHTWFLDLIFKVGKKKQYGYLGCEGLDVAMLHVTFFLQERESLSSFC